ncbi:MAG: peptide-methionine (R)-S-oxide reductase MsrB [Sideroxydans sp.]|nr:peptide-methionine (R)-S-oxide reductase MsrB [Sideroxydans sp.]
MDRRTFISLAAGSTGLLLLPGLGRNAFAAARSDKLILSDAEWKQKLTPQQYDILRKEGTERAYTSALNDEKRAGMFLCVACEQPLFPSRFKFDSGTGWPSFYDVLPGAVETSTDYKLIYPRTEYHCSRCGGHHGHVFEDGPRPTGLRYCNNGAVLKFVPEKG